MQRWVVLYSTLDEFNRLEGTGGEESVTEGWELCNFQLIDFGEERLMLMLTFNH